MDYYNHTLVPLDNSPLIIQSDHIKYPINSFPVQCLGKFDEVSEVANFDDIKAFEEPLEIILDLGALTCD